MASALFEAPVQLPPEASVRTGRRPRSVPGWLWALPPLVGLGLIFLYPLVLVGWQSVSPDTGGHSLAAWSDVLGSTAFHQALRTTVWVAAGSTVGCLVLGFYLAWVIAFVPFPGARLVGRFIDLFVALPSFLITLSLAFIYGSAGIANGAWSSLTGRHHALFAFLTTPWGVLLAEITYFTPFVMRPLLAAFSQVDTAQIEAAASLGARPGRIVRQVIVPEALPALAAGGSLVLVMSLNQFGIVLFTGAKDVTTLTLLVYSRAVLESDYPAACVIAVVNVVLSVALYSLYRLCLPRAGKEGGNRAGA
ncbi:2-aminoethylphosphonate ABC transporter permease subunit [Kitasatospora sp. NPDC059327]|uniref:2-aminoethylphosphonate ABC transporter permease subunit n=1 Tax=Kitasatospora sp. NPDC059327 TaxID=3346803 RepID=UPI00369B4930